MNYIMISVVGFSVILVLLAFYKLWSRKNNTRNGYFGSKSLNDLVVSNPEILPDLYQNELRNGTKMMFELKVTILE